MVQLPMNKKRKVTAPAARRNHKIKLALTEPGGRRAASFSRRWSGGHFVSTSAVPESKCSVVADAIFVSAPCTAGAAVRPVALRGEGGPGRLDPHRTSSWIC